MSPTSQGELTVPEAFQIAVHVIRTACPEWSDDQVKDGLVRLITDDWSHEEMAWVMASVLDYPPAMHRAMVEEILAHPGLHGYDHDEAGDGA
jgi:hypothetical protein